MEKNNILEKEPIKVYEDENYSFSYYVTSKYKGREDEVNKEFYESVANIIKKHYKHLF